jgi:hypothetical protein
VQVKVIENMFNKAIAENFANVEKEMAKQIRPGKNFSSI